MALKLLVILVTFLGLVVAAPKGRDKGHPNCQEFSRGVSFNDSQAVGSWHLLHFKTEKSNGTGNSHCVDFAPVTAQERTELASRIDKFVENLKWDNLTLKMQIPCSSLASNRTRNYYLEKLEGDGSYRTLQMPPSMAKIDLAEFHRYPMRLKIIEGQYLGMMDCLERFVFLMGRQPPGNQPDERLKKMIDMYWPDEE